MNSLKMRKRCVGIRGCGDKRNVHHTIKCNVPGSRRSMATCRQRWLCTFTSLCHVCNSMLLILIFLEHSVFKPLSGFGALRVDVGGPEVGDSVFDGEKGGNGEGPNEPVL